MAYTCPDIQGSDYSGTTSITNTRYYSTSKDKYYTKGATLPTIADGDEIEVYLGENWYSVYIAYNKSGTTTYPSGWGLEGPAYALFQVPTSINGKNFTVLGDANWGAYQLEYREEEEEYVPQNRLSSYPYTIPSGVKYMRAMFKDQDTLTGLIKVDANPTTYTNWLQGTVLPIKLAGQSTMLNSLASGYNNVTVLVKPSISVLAQRCDSQGNLDDEGTYAKITLNITADPVNTTYDIDIAVDGTVVHTTSNVTVSSTAEEQKTYVVGNGTYDVGTNYGIEVTVADSWSVYTVSATDTLSTAFYTIDVGNAGHEIVFGGPANDVLTGTDSTKGLFKCNMNAHFNEIVADSYAITGSESPIGTIIEKVGGTDYTTDLATGSTGTEKDIASIVLPKGTWIVQIRCRYTPSSSGAHYSKIVFSTTSQSTAMHDRSYMTGSSAIAHNVTDVIVQSNDEPQTYYLAGSVGGETGYWNRTSSAALLIRAVRIL